MIAPLLKTIGLRKAQKVEASDVVRLSSVRMEDGHILFDSKRFLIREIASVDMLHDVDSEGLNGSVDVYVDVTRKHSMAFGGRISERFSVGRVATDSDVAELIRTKVKEAEIPVIEF